MTDPVATDPVATDRVPTDPVAADRGTGGRELVFRSALHLTPDPSRVITALFVPGDETPGGDSRALRVTNRILGMDEGEVDGALATARARFAGRHRKLDDTWATNFRRVAHWLADQTMSPERELLIGAYFTHEISVETASLCNPSIVAHPDQSGLGPGQARFVMSLRAVSEGHVSAIEFRTGVVQASGELALDPPGPFPEAGRHFSPTFERRRFQRVLAEQGMDNDAAALILDPLGGHFDMVHLNEAIAGLPPQLMSRAAFRRTIERIRWVAANNYLVDFPGTTSIDERVLWPSGPTEMHGMEDARLVRFADDDGAVTYFATYTAYSGAGVIPQLISTTDFSGFRVAQLTGRYARNKGLAIFPRRVGGRYMALSRWDRETSWVATSEDGLDWSEAAALDLDPAPWEIIQTGNCGSPIETPEGWLVITHGVGPMRVYCLGALLLDLEDPTRVIAALDEPFLEPQAGDREGYVPNVVYSCGAMVHGAHLVLPYGLADSAVGLAVVDLPGLLERLREAKR